MLKQSLTTHTWQGAEIARKDNSESGSSELSSSSSKSYDSSGDPHPGYLILVTLGKAIFTQNNGLDTLLGMMDGLESEVSWPTPTWPKG